MRTEDGKPPLLTYSGMDPPQHTLHRRMAAYEFSPRVIAAARPEINRIVAARAEAFAKGPRPADVVRAFAEPVTADILGMLLGIPVTFREHFGELTKALLGDGTNSKRKEAASTSLRALVSSLLSAKEERHTDDVLGRLIRRYLAEGIYQREQLVELAGALISAGYETTSSMIALGVVILLEHPEQLDYLRKGTASYAGAVDELLRHASIADLVTARVALAECKLAGAVIAAGEGIVALSAEANHDHRVFNNPEDFDVRRDARNHVAFGYGRHRCLGQHLARLELEVALSTLFTTLPTIRLAIPVTELKVCDRRVILGVEEVPVTW